MLLHLWTNAEAPPQYVTLALCREWHCPPDVVFRQRLDDVHETLVMLAAESKVRQTRLK